MPTGLLTDPIFQEHDTGPGHPESALRLKSVRSALHEAGFHDRTTPLSLRKASLEELALAHDPGYVALARKEIEAGARQLSTGDTIVSRKSFEVAQNAAGGVMNAIDAVFQCEVDNAFCAMRPPGHHATHDRGMGFCVFNHIAIGARYAQKKYGIERVAIVDWDVHHGNGTQDIFWTDPSVFYFSTHQYPWYPGTGTRQEDGDGLGQGTILNAPFPAGTGMKDLSLAFTKGFLPAMRKFEPELILISAGFDSRIGDPLGKFRLEDDDFAELTKLVLEAATASADGRVVSVLEGGYRVAGLISATNSHLGALLGD
mgnify:CR=1 FL=1|tara:strand:- start:10824 stop:11765 length:942 start_codon:yes stop_codon:yes gene_type:complete